MAKESDGHKQSNESKSSEAVAESSAELQEEALEVEATSTQDEDTSFKQQLEEQKDNYLRLAAEFDNYRKRTRRDMADVIKSANESLIYELLDVLDNFERANKSREENSDMEAYSKGISLVYEKLLSILGNAGLKRFESVGQQFDPRLHEAIVQIVDKSKEPDIVGQEFQAGYNLNDKVLRHAKVSVVRPDGETDC